jgi:two-component system, sensor histidine kinase and response regulator
VRESGEALLTLINEILDFSKLAAGKMIFEQIDFELTAAVEGAVDLVVEQARRKDLELTVSIDSEAPQGLRGDPGRLRQVLLNLIGNAIKFTERGEVAVQVSKLSEGPKDIILRFEVRDSGIGIPQEKLHLLFQPFSQVDASTTRHFGGTGLGCRLRANWSSAWVEQSPWRASPGPVRLSGSPRNLPNRRASPDRSRSASPHLRT